jgi:hypothetical protein
VAAATAVTLSLGVAPGMIGRGNAQCYHEACIRCLHRMGRVAVLVISGAAGH